VKRAGIFSFIFPFNTYCLEREENFVPFNTLDMEIFLQGVNSIYFLYFFFRSITTGIKMEGVEVGKIQSLNIKNNDDTTDKNSSKTASVQAPRKWLQLIDADGKKRRAKRFVF
jgi:hypothetical protein